MILNENYTRDELRSLIGEGITVTVPQIFIDNRRVGGYEDLLEYFEDHFIFGIHQ